MLIDAAKGIVPWVGHLPQGTDKGEFEAAKKKFYRALRIYK